MAPLFELAIRRSLDSTLTAELRAFQRNSITLLAPAQPVTISASALRGLGTLPDAYGAALSAMVFPAVLREGWLRARGAGEVEGSDIQLRVLIDDPTGELHGLRWELLRDGDHPKLGAPHSEAVLPMSQHDCRVVIFALHGHLSGTLASRSRAARRRTPAPDRCFEPEQTFCPRFGMVPSPDDLPESYYGICGLAQFIQRAPALLGVLTGLASTAIGGRRSMGSPPL
jgi:hypothetical protein